VKSVLEIFFEIVLALTGAVAFATAVVGGSMLGLGCTIFGCGYAWRRWRRRRAAGDGAARDGQADRNRE